MVDYWGLGNTGFLFFCLSVVLFVECTTHRLLYRNSQYIRGLGENKNENQENARKTTEAEARYDRH